MEAVQRFDRSLQARRFQAHHELTSEIQSKLHRSIPMKTFNPTERMASLMELRSYAQNEIEELNERIANFPKLEPEYDYLPEIPEECHEQ